METVYSNLRTEQELADAYKEVAGMFTNFQVVKTPTKVMMESGHREFQVCQLSRLNFNTSL